MNTRDTQHGNEEVMHIEQAGTETQGTREPRHVEVFDHMRKRLDGVLRGLEALAGEIAKEPARDSVPESNSTMLELSLQDFLQGTVSENIDSFASEAMNQISRIKEMLF